MEIIKTNKELTPMEIYNLTMNPGTQRMRDFKDSEIEISAWALYNDDNVNPKTGEVESNEILTIQTVDGEVVGTNSGTFKKDFFKAVDLFHQFGQELHTIKVISGVSKAGREFITMSVVG